MGRVWGRVATEEWLNCQPAAGWNELADDTFQRTGGEEWATGKDGWTLGMIDESSNMMTCSLHYPCNNDDCDVYLLLGILSLFPPARSRFVCSVGLGVSGGLARGRASINQTPSTPLASAGASSFSSRLRCHSPSPFVPPPSAITASSTTTTSTLILPHRISHPTRRMPSPAATSLRHISSAPRASCSARCAA